MIEFKIGSLEAAQEKNCSLSFVEAGSRCPQAPQFVAPKAGSVLTLLQAEGGRQLLVACNNIDALAERDFDKLVRASYDALRDNGIEVVAIELGALEFVGRDESWLLKRWIELFGSYNYQFSSTKTLPESSRFNGEVTLLCRQPERLEQVLKQSQALVSGMNVARELADLPANICTPQYLADQAEALASSDDKLQVEVLDEQQMRELGMNVLLSVGAGSEQPSRFIVMHYRGATEADAPHVLLGKGITFDTGGSCLKSRDGMALMKYDMAGAAVVYGAMVSALELQLPINLVVAIASAENMPGSCATKPGDVVTSMSGKTVEINNTDAEGRLVLCDSLTYLERYKPASVVDVATLTGASVVALGRNTSALFANDQKLADKLLSASRRSGDGAWQLPLLMDEMSQLDTDFADISNMGNGTAASVVAALFLSRFAQSYPWAHLDVSGTAKRPVSDRGATGRPLPLLLQYLLDCAA